MPLHDFGSDIVKVIRAPARIAILVDDLRANAFDEIVPGDARQRDAVILLEALLNAAK